MQFKTQILSEDDIERIVKRIAHQILEKNHGAKDLCLLGIKTRGVPLANLIAANIKAIENIDVPVGELDITFYRDDLTAVSSVPLVKNTCIPFSVVDKTVILVDDVIFTGRTARAALDAVMAQGRPARIQLAVLIDRGHTELPIKANFVGKNIPTSANEAVSVQLMESDGKNCVVIYERKA